MKSFNWILISVFLFVLSAIVTWFMPEGLNLISQQFGQNTYPITPLVRLFTFMFSFLFMTGIEMIIWIRVEIEELKKEIPKILKNSLLVETRSIVNNSILQMILNSLSENPKNIENIYHILEGFTYPLSRLSSNVLDSYSVVIEGFIRKFNEDLKDLNQDGCWVNLREHLETTRWLAAKSKTYLQIQRKAFLAPDEWTSQWCQFLDWIKKRQIACEYIVLLDKQSLIDDRKKLESMNTYLSQRGFIFKYCILEDVQDSLGGNLPTQDNLEVFDSKIVKLQAPPPGGYRGGITLKMALFDILQRDDIRRLVHYVIDFSEKFS